ncbi:MAG: hypothetical protein GXO63_02510 [Candidatus Micrarchaeota archaeon]|nr:hypothetical protein [Candidatus Micrarchaeota archaeon]
MTSLCKVCLKSEILCSVCEEKLKKGEISPYEVKFSKTVHELSERFPPLKDAKFLKVVEGRNVLFVITEKNHAPRFVGRGGKIVRLLSEKMGTEIKIIDSSEDVKKIIDEISKPARVLTTSVVYTPNGTKRRIILSSEPPVKKAELSSLAEALTGEKVEVVW